MLVWINSKDLKEYREFKDKQEDFLLRKREFQISLRAMQLELDNLKTEHRIQENEKIHQEKLKRDELSASFEMEKKSWKMKQDLLERDRLDQLKAQQEKYENKIFEAESLLKLDFEQRLAKHKLEHEKSIQEITSKYEKEIIDLKTKFLEAKVSFESEVSKKYYNQLNDSLLEMQSKQSVINDTMKMIVEKVLDKGPMPMVQETRLITSHNKNK